MYHCSLKWKMTWVKSHPSDRDGNGNHIVSGSLYKATNPSIMLLDKDALCWVVNSQEFGRDGISKLFFFKRNFKTLGALEMEYMLALIKKPNSKTFANSQKGCSISLEEMYILLNYYGLKVPSKNERYLSMEAYSDSAHLWP